MTIASLSRLASATMCLTVFLQITPALAQPGAQDPFEDFNALSAAQGQAPDRGLAIGNPDETAFEPRKARVIKRLQDIIAIDQQTLRCVEGATEPAAIKACQLQRQQHMRALMPNRPHPQN